MKLHITNLSPKTTEQALKELFEPFGAITDIHIEWFQTAGRSPGNAIVQMGISEATQAAKELHGHPFRNRRLYVSIIEDAQPKSFASVSYQIKSHFAKKDNSN